MPPLGSPGAHLSGGGLYRGRPQLEERIPQGPLSARSPGCRELTLPHLPGMPIFMGRFQNGAFKHEANEVASGGQVKDTDLSLGNR